MSRGVTLYILIKNLDYHYVLWHLLWEYRNVYLRTEAIVDAAGDVQQVTVWAGQAVLGRAAVARGARLVALSADGSPGRRSGPGSPISPHSAALEVVLGYASPGLGVLLPVGLALHAPAAVVRVAPGAALRARHALPYPAVRVESLGALVHAVPLVEKGPLVMLEEVQTNLN